MGRGIYEEEGDGGKGEMVCVDRNKQHYIHVWNYQNENHYYAQLIYANKSKIYGKKEMTQRSKDSRAW